MAQSTSRSTAQSRTQTGVRSREERKRELRARSEEIEATGGSYQGTHATIWLHNGDSESDHAVMVSAHALPDYADSHAMNGCSCQDWTFRSPEGGCKHMQAIRQVVKVAASLASDDHVTEEELIAMMDVPESAARAVAKAVDAE